MAHLSTQCPFSTSTKPISIFASLPSFDACGHLVLKTQPEGGLIGLGISPFKIILFLFFLKICGAVSIKDLV